MRFATLTAMGLGGALVYMLDPERGGHRRALLRDKVQALQDRVGDPATARHRASELADRARAFVRQNIGSPETLKGRARSRLEAYPGAQRLFDAGTSSAAGPFAAAAGALVAAVALRRTAVGRMFGATGASLLANTLMERQAYGRR
jgi:hypothetical protein